MKSKMKKVLLFTLEGQAFQEVSQIEAAAEHVAAGDDVLYVTCGSSVGSCSINRKANRLQCAGCKCRMAAHARKFAKGVTNIHSIDEYMTDGIRQTAERQTFDFTNVQELKAVKYNNIEIGYGALSSYITYTRNIDADVKAGPVRDYIEYLLRMQIRMILAMEQVINDFRPDLMIVHNGRFAHYKPIRGLAQNHHIDYICTENLPAPNGEWYQDNYENGTPHVLAARDRQIKKIWDMNPDEEEKRRIGRSFFENRRHAKYSGDTIYTKDQKLGTLPDDWDEKKENIVIFNSSEDEFFAIGSDCGVKSVFGSQLEGIKAIAQHYRNDKTKHFTLRIHPHLKGLPFSYHQELYKLDYDNLTVIPADSPVSSYSLMDGASKIIVFGSTMGIESSYWQKPVINLAFAMYNLMDAVYIPDNEAELWSMIDNKALPPKPQDNALPYGYYIMATKKQGFRYAKDMTHQKILRILGNKYYYNPAYTLLGSAHLYGIWRSLMWRFEGRIPGLCRFREVPL